MQCEKFRGNVQMLMSQTYAVSIALFQLYGGHEQTRAHNGAGLSNRSTIKWVASTGSQFNPRPTFHPLIMAYPTASPGPPPIQKNYPSGIPHIPSSGYPYQPTNPYPSTNPLPPPNPLSPRRRTVHVYSDVEASDGSNVSITPTTVNSERNTFLHQASSTHLVDWDERSERTVYTDPVSFNSKLIDSSNG